ncbi:MAG TPA: hypothetical protein VK183_13365 [Flavobacterium sp.]|nr:hypothetical protein [Flavobacterium sp.]
MSHFQPLLDLLLQEGFHLPASSTGGKPLAYNFTPYSLNNRLSFRFEHVDDFIHFLETSGSALSADEKDTLRSSLLKAGLDAESFFYVNFFEKGKEQDM